MTIRTLGKTVALSVEGTSHTAVAVGADIQDAVTKAAFLNPGSTTVAITMAPGDQTAPASVLPIDGTPSAANIVLPPSMRQPVVYATPKAPFSMTAIGSAAGPSVIYVTPCEE